MRLRLHFGLTLTLSLLAGVPGAAQTPPATPLPLRATGLGHTQGIVAGVFTPDSKTFLSSAARVIHAWDPADGRLLYILKGHPAPIQGLAIANGLLISGSEDGTLFLWDLAQRKQVGELPRFQHPVHGLSVSPDGKRLAVSSWDWNKPLPAELRLFDLGTRKEIAKLEHQHPVRALDFAPDGKSFAALDRASNLTLWDVTSRKASLVHLESEGCSLRFSPDSKRLAIGDWWGRIRILDIATLADEAEVKLPRGPVAGLGYHPSGNILASAGHDGHIFLWNPHDLEEQAPLKVDHMKARAWVAVFSPDGKTLATAGGDKRVKFWNVTPELLERFRPPAPLPPPVDRVVRAGPVKVALIAPTDATRAVQDLALVRLSDAAGVELLERERIDRLLAEQKLSLAGVVEAATAVRAGQILAADLIAVIEHSPTLKQTAGLVVFDAATGARLADIRFTAPNAAGQAVQAASAVQAAIGKWRAGLKNLRTACFLPPRNADLPRGMDSFCVALTAGLERDLLGSERAAVLERTRLDLLNQEKTLAQNAATRELLASLVIVEVELARAQPSGIRASVVLRDNAGKELQRLTQETRDAGGAGLLGPLAQQLQEALKTAVPNALANRSRESRRFQREAKLLWRHKHYLQGLQAAEAAFALKDSDDARNLLVEYLVCSATELVDPGGMESISGGYKYKVTPAKLREVLGLVRRAFHLIDAGRAHAKDASDVMDVFEVTSAQRFFFNKLGQIQVEPPEAAARTEWLDFRKECVERLVRRCELVARNADRDPIALTRFAAAIGELLENMLEVAPTTADYTRAMHGLGLKWLDLAGKHRNEDLPLNVATSFGSVLDTIYRHYLHPSLVPKGEGPPLGVLERALKHPHPIIRIHAQHIQRRMLVNLGKLSREQAIAGYRTMLEEAKRLIDQPPFTPHDKLRIATYYLLYNICGNNHLEGRAVVQELEELCEFMLARNDVVEEVICNLISHRGPSKTTNLRMLQIVDRAVALTDSPKLRHFGGSPERFKNAMKQGRHDLLTTLPELLRVKPPWESVQRVVTGTEVGGTFVSAQIHDKHIYLFAGGGDANDKFRQLQLVRLPVLTQPGSPVSKPQVLGKTLVSVDNPPEWSRQHIFWYYPDTFVPATAIADGKIYAGTTTDGILVFPLAGGAPQRIGEKEGLPARRIHKLAIVERTLLAILEGGYIVAYDLDKRTCTTLASSRRSGTQSPFDNATPFRGTDLIADPERRRFLFSLAVPGPNDPRAGLWEFSLKTAKFRKAHAGPISRHHGGWGVAWGPVQDGRLYAHEAESLFALDLATDRLQFLHGKADDYVGDLPRGSLDKGTSVALPRGLVHGGWWWKSNPFGRRSLAGPAEELYPSLHDNSWQYTFAPTISFQALGPRELLIGDHSVLYRVRLKE